MKKKLLLLMAFIFCQNLFSQELTITGQVLEKNGQPVPYVNITNKISNANTTSDFDGMFTITYTKEDEQLVFNSVGFETVQIPVKYLLKSKKIIIKEESPQLSEVIVSTSGLSFTNYWLGAKVGYNFVSNSDDDNFIGSAIVSLNMLKSDSNKNTFGVIGNIGDFKFTKDTAEVAKIEKLAQSINGIAIGLGYEYKKDGLFGAYLGNNNFKSKLFITSVARFTTYKNIGVENESVNFVQNVNTLGTEFSLSGFQEEGQLTLTLSSSLMLFDPNKYQLIFENKKSHLVTYETTLIIPIQKKIGFFVNGTFSSKSSAVFSFGIALK